VRKRERAQKNSSRNRRQFETLLTESKVSPRLQDALAVEMAQKAERNDPILELLLKFFLVNDGYWLRFFDKRNQPRKKKRPNFPTTRKWLVQRLLAPERLGLAASGWTLTRRDAHELAALCMKAAYPRIFPKSLDGESVRLATQYHDQMVSRPASQRPRYDRI
jgi:hypothetical protein